MGTPSVGARRYWYPRYPLALLSGGGAGYGTTCASRPQLRHYLEHLAGDHRALLPLSRGCTVPSRRTVHYSSPQYPLDRPTRYEGPKRARHWIGRNEMLISIGLCASYLASPDARFSVSSVALRYAAPSRQGQVALAPDWAIGRLHSPLDWPGGADEIPTP